MLTTILIGAAVSLASAAVVHVYHKRRAVPPVHPADKVRSAVVLPTYPVLLYSGFDMGMAKSIYADGRLVPVREVHNADYAVWFNPVSGCIEFWDRSTLRSHKKVT